MAFDLGTDIKVSICLTRLMGPPRLRQRGIKPTVHASIHGFYRRLTMQTAPLAPNPFALMLDPAAIFAAMDQSGRLGGLKRQIFRPLDKPLIARANAASAAFDDEIDEELEGDE